MGRSSWILVVAGLVGVNAGCARSEHDVKERFETAIHARDSGWGTVCWDNEHEPGTDWYGARVSHGGHLFWVSHAFAACDVFVDQDDKRRESDDKGYWSLMVIMVHDADQTVNQEFYRSHCQNKQQEDEIKAQCLQLTDALYHAIH